MEKACEADNLEAVKKYKTVYRKRLIRSAILVLFFEIILIYSFCNSTRRSGSIDFFLLLVAVVDNQSDIPLDKEPRLESGYRLYWDCNSKKPI